MSSNILFVLSKAEPPCFKAVKQAISESSGFELMEAANFAEAEMVLTEDWIGLVVLIVAHKDDLAKTFHFVASRSNAIRKRKTVRVVVFNQLTMPKVISTLLTQGCAEVLDFKVTGKTVIHKFQRHIKLLKAVTSSAEDEILEARGREKDSRSDDDEDEDAPKNTVQAVPPLAHPRDFWLTREQRDAKRVMARWMVEMIGPAPSAGEWLPIPLQGETTKGASAFAWRARDPQGKFATPDGQWVFIGRTVEFVWRENRWRFVGDRISLTYQEGGKVVATRFEAESASLIKIAGNSGVAMALRSAIDATYSGQLQPSKSGASSPSEEDEEGELDLSDEGMPQQGRSPKRKRDADAHRSGEPEVRLTGDEGESEKLNERFAKAREKPGTDRSGHISEDEEPANWNDNVREDEKPADWNDHGAHRQNIFNHGRGLGQGHKSDQVLYGLEDFSTGADAFKPIGVSISLDSHPAELLDQSERSLKLIVMSTGFAQGSTASLEVRTENLTPDTPVLSACRILRLEVDQESGYSSIEVELDDAANGDWKRIQNAVEIRQQVILEFLKVTRGS